MLLVVEFASSYLDRLVHEYLPPRKRPASHKYSVDEILLTPYYFDGILMTNRCTHAGQRLPMKSEIEENVIN